MANAGEWSFSVIAVINGSAAALQARFSIQTQNYPSLTNSPASAPYDGLINWSGVTKRLSAREKLEKSIQPVHGFCQKYLG